MCLCVTVVLADVSCRLIDVQAATYVWRISCSVQLLGDDQCVDVMNKKLIIDVFGVLHLFLSCCTALLVKGAACQLESYMYDYIYEGKGNFGPFTCLVHCVTHGASCSIPQVFLSITSTHRSSPSENVYRTGDFPNTSLTCM